jgi:hypothetical protein
VALTIPWRVARLRAALFYKGFARPIGTGLAQCRLSILRTHTVHGALRPAPSKPPPPAWARQPNGALARGKVGERIGPTLFAFTLRLQGTFTIYGPSPLDVQL